MSTTNVQMSEVVSPPFVQFSLLVGMVRLIRLIRKMVALLSQPLGHVDGADMSAGQLAF
jgi:hypothetical protein